MELFQVEIVGFRKFREKAELKTRGKVVAILGANEAGKSSLLKALVHMNDHEPFSREDFSTGTDGTDCKVKLKFCLADEEKVELGIEQARWFTLEKCSNGSFIWSIEPRPNDRDFSYRSKLSSAWKKILENKNGSLILTSLNEEVTERTDQLVSELNNANGELPADFKQRIKDTAWLWESILTSDNPKYLHSFHAQLNEAYSLEKAKSVVLVAGETLLRRVPKFLIFSNEDRELRSSYPWIELSNIQAIAPALRNLATIAGLDLPSLADSMTKNPADTENDNIIEIANAALEKQFNDTWKQSKVSVVLSKSDQSLLIQIRNNEKRRTDFNQRSDGLRQFVALLCFTAAREDDDFVLLIDEAEQHLHYDAQADLVQMFGRQNVASKVIYTTHSVGCLPEDLGNGVRLVEPINSGSDWSRIENKFWRQKKEHEAAFSPILMGMGASTMAFFPTRSAVILEGAADTIILPTMFREALDEENLGVQFIHGISEDAQMQLPLLNSAGREVVYLLDNDEGGRTLRADLIRRGLPENRVYSLNCEHGDCELEDFIDSGLLANAVTDYCELFYSAAVILKREDLPKIGKWDFIKNAFTLEGLEAPSKVEIAYAVLNRLDREPNLKLLDKNYRKSFVAIAQKVRSTALRHKLAGD